MIVFKYLERHLVSRGTANLKKITMKLLLNDKVIIVSGVGRGIGEGIVRALSDKGAIPVIIGHNEANNIKLVKEIKQAGGKAWQLVTDFSSAGACETAVKKVMQHFGRIDGLVNNAGVNDGINLEHGTYEKLMISLHSNTVHYYLLAHFNLPELMKLRKGAVNANNNTGQIGRKGVQAGAAHSASNALTKEWALELLKYGIRINAVVLAEGHTPLYKSWFNSFPNPEAKIKEIVSRIPLGRRMTTVEEIANSAAFLLSARAGHTTGQLIHADGGYLHLDPSLAN